MEPAPPDHQQRHRLSWSSTSGPHGGVPSLPRPHSSTTNPLPLPRVHNHPQPPYASFTPRPADLHSAPPTPVHPSPVSHHPEPDRRHHDQEPYAPMHDHYQPQQQQQHHHHPVSPAQGHYQQSYPPRDPSLVKREPHDDSRRSSSTGHATDISSGQHPPTPHHSLPPPPAYPDNQPRHMNYDNGHPVPGGYRQPSYPPPTPVAQQAQYEPPHTSYSNNSDPYYSVYPSSIPAKKKNTRASQACDQCRQLKAKCDETKPCKTCRDKGLECRYRDPVPKATDKAQADILEGITSMQNTLVALVERFDRMDNRLTTVEKALKGGALSHPAPMLVPIKNDPVGEEEAKPVQQSPIVNGHVGGGQPGYYQPQPQPPQLHLQTQPQQQAQAEAQEQARAQAQAQEQARAQAQAQEQQAQAQAQAQEQAQTQAQTQAQPQQPPGPDDPDYPPATLPAMNEEEAEPEPGRPIPPGEPAIPMNHTTLAGLLLEWPSIRELTRKHVEKVGIRYISEYPISVEQSRGPLLVYGRGEDNHSYRHIVKEPENHGTVDIADDNSSDMASPSPAADFGLVGGLSPPDMVEYKGGVLAFDGTPDFTELKVWAYVESFKDHILNMHPIITPKTLENWVRQFLDNLPMSHPRSAKPQAVKPAFAFASTPTQTPTEQTGSKRKRSPGPDGSETPMTPGPIRTGKPTRSVHSALVLTILALGKICMHRDNIPDVVHPQPTSDSGSHGSPSIRNGVIPPSSPSQGSPPGPHSYSQSPAQASPMDQSGRGSHSRRPSIHGTSGHTRPGYSLKKNFDVIPGLEYFAYATDILGNLTGSYNNMKNVYANIFASLYQGQLGRPLESFAFIHKASHQLQVLMRPSLDKLQAFKKKNEFIVQPKYNNLALAFWTCLQLESDLIAEFPLPPSGLLSYEDDMPHPSMILMAGFDQRILDSYPGQLYLRTHLNSIHRMFYAPDDPDGSINDNKFQNVDLVADAVSGMHWVAPSLSFKEDDPPGEDILSARLRAKYWGAQVITYRPFVRQILQFSYSVKNGVQEDEDDPSSRWSEFRSGIIAPFIHPDTKSLKEIPAAMIELARKGINALIESTRAFHGLGDQRPIITNVFGTAHAQWGNLLVLSAAFKDPVLGRFVPEDLLKHLFHKTIAFLRQSATATSSLRFDMIILEGLQRDLFSPPEPPRTNSSFSSHASTTQPRASATATPHMSHVILNQGHGTPPISPRMREPYNTSAPN